MRRQPSSPSPAPEAALRSLAAIASELRLADLAATALGIADRLAAGRVYVACVGQFKRGKSTLLNALIGVELLPTGVVPVTSVIVIVRHAERPFATVRLASGARQSIPVADLRSYVTEEHNPENVKGVAAVEVGVPNPLLASGLCLVDTPGVASVFAAGTATTRAFVPQIDAAIVVLGADPPISADELALVDEIARETRELIFVIAKADRTSDSERGEARRFAERVLATRLGRPVDTMLEVSATERLAGIGPPRDWRELEARVAAIAEHRGRELVEAAGTRGVQVIADRILHEVDERDGALRRPIEESERRIEMLRECSRNAEQALRDVTALLEAERARLHQRFVARQDAFLERALPMARRKLADALEQLDVGGRTQRWRAACALVQDLFRPLLTAWQQGLEPLAADLYAEATSRFAELGDALLRRVAVEANLAPGGLLPILAGQPALAGTPRVYFTELLSSTARTPGQWLAAHVLPRARFEAALGRQAATYLERLVATNASRITADLDERVLDSRRRLEHELRGQLRYTYDVAERALEEARRRREDGVEATEDERRRLADHRRAVEALRRAPSPAYMEEC